MIFLFFALMFLIVLLYFKQIEDKWDYILVAVIASLAFVQLVASYDEGFYNTLAFQKTTNCTFTYVANLTNSSSCLEYNTINLNASAGAFKAADFYAFKAFDGSIISLSGIMLWGILLLGILYVAIKGLKIEGMIKGWR